jgi:hypothetical protein
MFLAVIPAKAGIHPAFAVIRADQKNGFRIAAAPRPE